MCAVIPGSPCRADIHEVAPRVPSKIGVIILPAFQLGKRRRRSWAQILTSWELNASWVSMLPHTPHPGLGFPSAGLSPLLQKSGTGSGNSQCLNLAHLGHRAICVGESAGCRLGTQGQTTGSQNVLVIISQQPPQGAVLSIGEDRASTAVPRGLPTSLSALCASARAAFPSPNPPGSLPHHLCSKSPFQ